MIRILTLLVITLFISACSDSQDTAAEATKSVVKFSKEVLGGISSGIDEGRKEAEGLDGAIVVTNIDELEQSVKIELLKVRSLNNDQKTEVEIGFKNNSEKPIRIANLDDRATVLLIDTDGYAQELDRGNRHGAEITVPPNAGIKHNLLFNIPVSKAKILRLWNKEYEIKNVPILKETDGAETETI